MTRFNPALRIGGFERAEVTNFFRKSDQFSGSSEKLTIR